MKRDDTQSRETNPTNTAANLGVGAEASSVATRYLLDLLKLLAAAFHQRRVEALRANDKTANGESLVPAIF